MFPAMRTIMRGRIAVMGTADCAENLQEAGLSHAGTGRAGREKRKAARGISGPASFAAPAKGIVRTGAKK